LSPYFSTDWRTGIDRIVKVVRANSVEEILQFEVHRAYGLDNNSTAILTDLDALIDFEAGLREDIRGDAHRRAVSPFLN